MPLIAMQRHETNGVTANGTTTIDVPVGGKIQSLFLVFRTAAGFATATQIATAINKVSLIIGGHDLVSCSAKQLQQIRRILRGNSIAVGATEGHSLELLPMKQFYAEQSVRDIFGLGTADVTSIQIHLDVGNNAATITEVDCYTMRENTVQNLGSYFHIRDFPINFNSAGEHVVTTIPRAIDLSYLMILMSDENGNDFNIESGELIINANSLYQKISYPIMQAQVREMNLNINAKEFLYLFGDRGIAAHLAMAGVNALEFRTTFKAAPNGSTYHALVLGVKNYPRSN